MTPNSTHNHCHSFNDGVLKCATNTYDISCNTYDETQVTADCIPIDTNMNNIKFKELFINGNTPKRKNNGNISIPLRKKCRTCTDKAKSFFRTNGPNKLNDHYIVKEDNLYNKFFDYTKDTSNLPLIDHQKYPEATPNARNEVTLLISVYKHPDCYSAKSISGQDYKVDCVFDNRISGGKSVVVVLALTYLYTNMYRIR